MSNVFLDYASYYDLMYQDKDYKSEVDFIIRLLKKNAPEAKHILNLGCGTGRHDQYLAKAGYEVTGVDLSEEMIKIAQQNNFPNCKFFHGDARHLKFDQKFDAVISLFHVLSYQTSNSDVSSFFDTVYKLLTSEGIAIFDYWYGPAVLTIKPEDRAKKIDSNKMSVSRFATTGMDFVNNVATVHYKIDIKNNETDVETHFNEKHPMRYFFTPELELFLSKSQLKHIQHLAWPSLNDQPNEKTWAAYSIVKKY